MRDDEGAVRAPQGPRCPGRRSVLTGLGVAGLVTALAGCGARSGTVPGADGPAASGGAAPSPAGSASASASPVLAKTSDVPKGGGTVAAGVLIVQPAAGQFKAYKAACPHMGAVVGTPVNAVITCPSHGSTFKASDGSLISGVAPRGLTAVPIKVNGTDIVRA